MIKQLEMLTSEECQFLYQAPVLVSVLASCSYNSINEEQKADAIKLAHLKTYTALPLLVPYYVEVEAKFQNMFDEVVAKYSPFDEKKRNDLKKEIKKLDSVISKLDPEYGKALRLSLERYARHVKRANHSIFQDFVFPMYIKGLNE